MQKVNLGNKFDLCPILGKNMKWENFIQTYYNLKNHLLGIVLKQPIIINRE